MHNLKIFITSIFIVKYDKFPFLNPLSHWNKHNTVAADIMVYYHKIFLDSKVSQTNLYIPY